LPSAMDVRITKSMMDWAWDNCNHESHQRDGVIMADNRDYIETFEKATTVTGSPHRRHRQFALAAAALTGSLIRRDACARVHVDIAHARTDMVYFSEEELQVVTTPCHWSLDDKLRPSWRVCPTWEKNQPRSVSTTRYLSDYNVVDIKFATISQNIIRSIYRRDGPLLRQWDQYGNETGTAWASDDWSEFLDHYFDHTGHTEGDRKKLGAQSFRRGFATALRDAGCTEEEIRFLGYWWSTAAREYTGTSRQMRLDLQSKIQGEESKVPRDPLFYFGNARPNVR
jgi:hypothetical protein